MNVIGPSQVIARSEHYVVGIRQILTYLILFYKRWCYFKEHIMLRSTAIPYVIVIILQLGHIGGAYGIKGNRSCWSD